MINVTTKDKGTKGLLFAVLGAGIVGGLFTLTMLLQRIGHRELVIKLSFLIGLGTIIGLILCLASIILGFSAIATKNNTERRRASLSISIGLLILIGFAYYFYLSMQSPNFRPVH